MSTPSEPVVYEVRILKTKQRPNSVRFGRWRPWRWDVTAYRVEEGVFRGVYDSRLHLGSCGMGYEFSRRRAYLLAGRLVAEKRYG